MSRFLPNFCSTEEARRYGRKMSWLRAQQLCRKKELLKNKFQNEVDLQQRVFIAVDLQLIREALEEFSKRLTDKPELAEIEAATVN